MADGAGHIIDLTDGIYRRVYAGYIEGRRINAVSLQAEAWFWRINAVADDFGNFPAEPHRLRDLTAGKRRDSVKVTAVEKMLAELVGAGLIETYVSAGEQYGSVVGFTEVQPGGKNGKRVKKFPGRPGESGGIQNHRIETGSAHKQEQVHGHKQEQDQVQGHGQTDRPEPGQDLSAPLARQTAPPDQTPAQRRLARGHLEALTWGDGDKLHRSLVDRLLKLPGCTAERVWVLAQRARTEKPDNAAAWITAAIEDEWGISEADAKLYRTWYGEQTAAASDRLDAIRRIAGARGAA